MSDIFTSLKLNDQQIYKVIKLKVAAIRKKYQSTYKSTKQT